MLPVQFLDKVLDMPVVVLRQVRGSTVQKTGLLCSCSSPKAVDIPFVPQKPWTRLFSGSMRFCNCRSFFGGRCPCCAGRADSQVPPWRRPRSQCFFFFRQAQGARHQGQYGSEGQLFRNAARAVFPVKGLDVPAVCNVRCWP